MDGLPRREAESDGNPEPHELSPQLLALIHNCRREHGYCTLARGRYGMAGYGKLGVLLAQVGPESLAKYLGEIDEVRSTHSVCMPCSLKFLAFCMAFSRGRLPGRFDAYKAEFAVVRDRYPQPRNFHAEIADAISEARKERKPGPTNVRYFRTME